MEIKHTRDGFGRLYRHILSRQYGSLKELEKEYMKRGVQTWFDVYDSCEGRWCLSILV